MCSGTLRAVRKEQSGLLWHFSSPRFVLYTKLYYLYSDIMNDLKIDMLLYEKG